MGTIGSIASFGEDNQGNLYIVDLGGELFQVVPFELFGVASGNMTAGHPVLSPQEFEIKSGADYRRKMARRGIEVRFEVRKEKLLQKKKHHLMLFWLLLETRKSRSLRQ